MIIYVLTKCFLWGRQCCHLTCITTLFGAEKGEQWDQEKCSNSPEVTERAERWFEAGKCGSRIRDFSCHILTQCSSQHVSFSPRQFLAIRSPRWGRSCCSLPFRKDCKTYPGWKGLEMYKSTSLARAFQMASHHWTASYQESARSVWPVEGLMDAHAPLAFGVQVSGEKKGFWHKFLNCPTECKVLHWVTNRTPSRKITFKSSLLTAIPDTFLWYRSISFSINF